MQEIMEELARQAEADLAQVASKETLAAFWQKYLSKNGQVPALMKQLRTVDVAERPAMGKAINELKQKVQADYDAAAVRVGQAELAARNAAETVDITLPAKTRPAGGLHPLTLVRNQIIDAFAGMGFEIYEGPEIEDDDHCFTRLNVPKDHPARDMQDTFYLSDELLLRTQTSTGQIRTMDAERPPIKVLVPGRVFRSDSDATHSPMFHQMEGLVVDKGITLCDLQGMLDVSYRSTNTMQDTVWLYGGGEAHPLLTVSFGQMEQSEAAGYTDGNYIYSTTVLPGHIVMSVRKQGKSVMKEGVRHVSTEPLPGVIMDRRTGEVHLGGVVNDLMDGEGVGIEWIRSMESLGE